MAPRKGFSESMVEVPFGGGLAQNADSISVEPPMLASLINGKLNKDGSIRRRRPANIRDATGISAAAQENLNSIFTHQNSSLVVNTDEGPYVFTEQTGWSSTNGFGQPPCEVSTRREVSCPSYFADSAVSGGYTGYVVLEDDGVYFIAYGYETGALACPKTRIVTSTTALNPKIIADETSGVFHVFCTFAASFPVACVRIDSADFPTTSGVSFTGGIANVIDQYDVCFGPDGDILLATSSNHATSDRVDVYRLSPVNYATIDSVADAQLSGYQGIGVHWNESAGRVYWFAYDANADTLVHQFYAPESVLGTVTTGPTFLAVYDPAPFAGVGAPKPITASGMVVTCAYAGDGTSNMLATFSFFYNQNSSRLLQTTGGYAPYEIIIDRLSYPPSPADLYPLTSDFAITRGFLVDSSLVVQDTLVPQWNYYAGTKAWNKDNATDQPPNVGLVRLYGLVGQVMTTFPPEGAARPNVQAGEQLQNTMLVCSYARDTNPTTPVVEYRVLARCHDDIAASPPYTVDAFFIANDTVSAKQYLSRLSFVSFVDGEYAFARPVYTSFGDTQTEFLNVDAAPADNSPSQRAMGVIGRIQQTRIAYECSPRRKDSAAGVSLVSSGYVGAFDGQNTYDNSWHSYPEITADCTPQYEEFLWDARDVTPGSVTVHTTARLVYMAFVYAWEDAHGNIHRSAPSPTCIAAALITEQPTFDTQSNDGFSYSISPVISDMPMSVYGRGPEKRFVEVYISGQVGRVVDDSSLKYPVPDIVDDTLHLCARVPYDANESSPDYTPRLPGRPWSIQLPLILPFLPGTGENPFANMPLLYTEGDTLESLPPPAFVDLVATQDRVWGISAENPNLIWFSKTLEPAVAPEFNGNLTIPLLPGTGPCVAIAALDEKVIVFKQNSIYVITGDGPNNTGGGNSFPTPQALSTDIGCVSRVSVIRGPFGVVFQSARGIYLLDRGLNLTWIGKPVEDTIALAPIVGAVLVPEETHVRFFTDDLRIAVWDYDVDQWGLYDSSGEVAGTVYRGGFAGLLNGTTVPGVLFSQEVDNNSAANGMYLGVATLLSFTTAWIRTAGFQGFQRVKRALMLFRPSASGTESQYGGLRIRTQFNYRAEATPDIYEWTPTEVTAAPNKRQYEAHLKQQKCESVRFLVSETANDEGSIGTDSIFSRLSLLVMSKAGRFMYLRDGSKK